jgi:hypothetical protein
MMKLILTLASFNASTATDLEKRKQQIEESINSVIIK